MRLKDEFYGGLIRLSIADAISRCDFIGGESVREFEDRWGSYNHASAVGVANGTDALRLALQAKGVGPGSTVCVPALTFGATAEAVRQLGADVIFSDIDPVTYLMADPPDADFYVPVALFGEPVELERPGVIDGAQAHGTGMVGDIAWSHFPSKPLGCFGDGGSVTGSPEFVERVRLLANHGMRAKYDYAEVGWNSRLDAIQARVLLQKLGMLDELNALRRDNAHTLISLCSAADVVLPQRSERSAYHLFVVRHDDPDTCISRLADMGVSAARYYHTPLHKTDAYKTNQHLPVAEEVCRTMFAVPCFATMTEYELRRVAIGLLSL